MTLKHSRIGQLKQLCYKARFNLMWDSLAAKNSLSRHENINKIKYFARREGQQRFAYRGRCTAGNAIGNDPFNFMATDAAGLALVPAPLSSGNGTQKRPR